MIKSELEKIEMIIDKIIELKSIDMEDFTSKAWSEDRKYSQDEEQLEDAKEQYFSIAEQLKEILALVKVRG